MQPANTLYARVSVKKRPYSNQPLSISITASFNPNFTATNAQYFSELAITQPPQPLHKIHATLAKFQTQANAASLEVVKFANIVFQYVTSVA